MTVSKSCPFTCLFTLRQPFYSSLVKGFKSEIYVLFKMEGEEKQREEESVHRGLEHSLRRLRSVQKTVKPERQLDFLVDPRKSSCCFWVMGILMNK